MCLYGPSRRPLRGDAYTSEESSQSTTARFGNCHTTWLEVDKKKTAERQYGQDNTLLIGYLSAVLNLQSPLFYRSDWGLPTQDEMTSGLQTMMDAD
jgi:hypothetical protein